MGEGKLHVKSVKKEEKIMNKKFELIKNDSIKIGEHKLYS